jgi:hypothetical protein
MLIQVRFFKVCGVETGHFLARRNGVKPRCIRSEIRDAHRTWQRVIERAASHRTVRRNPELTKPMDRHRAGANFNGV